MKVEKKYISKLTVGMVVLLGTVAMLSEAIVVVPIQEVTAAASTTFTFDQKQTIKCIDFVGCSNTGTITFSTGHHDSE